MQSELATLLTELERRAIWPGVLQMQDRQNIIEAVTTVRALAAENGRMREALRSIAVGKMQGDAGHPMGAWFSMAGRFIRIAREQLTTPGNGKETV